MILDLLSQSNQMSFNILIAQMFGLESAVYLSELMTINEKAVRKNKMEKIGSIKYFTVSREYIKSRTTITPAKQKEIDERLRNVGVISISKDNDNMLCIDYNILAGIFGTDLEKDTKEKIQKIAKKRTQEQKEASKESAKISKHRFFAYKEIDESDLADPIKLELKKWVDCILEKSGYITAAAVRDNIQAIKDYKPNDIQLSINLINYAILKCWVHISAAIDSYNKKEVSFPRNEELDRKIALENLSGEVF